MKEKLIELLNEATHIANSFCLDNECDTCEHSKNSFCLSTIEADHLIANDVVIQKHGKWVRKPTGKLIAFSETNVAPEYKEFCSLCDVPNKHYKPPYCPHCGAKMDGDSE